MTFDDPTRSQKPFTGYLHAPGLSSSVYRDWAGAVPETQTREEEGVKGQSPARPIPDAIERLAQNLAHLQASVSMLEERLKAALNPAPSLVGEHVSAQETHSPLLEQIDQGARAVRGVQLRINALLDSLEL